MMIVWSKKGRERAIRLALQRYNDDLGMDTLGVDGAISFAAVSARPFPPRWTAFLRLGVRLGIAMIGAFTLTVVAVLADLISVDTSGSLTLALSLCYLVLFQYFLSRRPWSSRPVTQAVVAVQEDRVVIVRHALLRETLLERIVDESPPTGSFQPTSAEQRFLGFTYNSPSQPPVYVLFDRKIERPFMDVTSLPGLRPEPRPDVS